MISVKQLDLIIYYLLLAYALASGFSRGGSNTTIALLILFTIIRYIYEPFKIKVEAGIIRGMAILFAAFVLSSAFSGNVRMGLEFLVLTIIKIAPFFIVLAFVKEEKKIEKIVWLMAGSLLLGSMIAIWQGMNGMVRARSFLGVMDFAGVIGLAFPLFLVHAFEFNGKKTWYNGVFFLVISAAGLALVYNGTRSVWLAVFINVILYALLNAMRNKRILMIISIMLIATFAFGSTNSHISARVQSIFDTKTNASNVQRLNIWIYGWDTFRSHPIIGIGLGCIPDPDIIDGTVRPKALNGIANGHHVHNNFLQMLAENGIIGFGAFCYLFGTILYSLWKKMKLPETRLWGTIAFLCTIDFLIHGFFDYTFKLSVIMYSYWFILGLAYANFAINAEKKSNL